MLVVNNLISYIKDNEEDIIERVLWLDYKEDIGAFIDINANKFPYFRKISDVQNYIDNEKASLLLEDPLVRIINEDSIPIEYIQRRNEIWDTIKDVVELEPHIYNSKDRRKYIVSISDKYNIHENTIARYMKRYWQRGKIKNALLPDYNLCGGRGSDREVGDVKRGRPRKHSDIIGKGINIDDEIKRIFKIAINKYYYNSSQKTLTLTNIISCVLWD